MDIPGKLCIPRLESGAVGEVDVIVVDERGGHSDERDVSSEAPVVVPVVADRGDAVDQARCVNRDDDEVEAWVKDCRNFAIERRESAFVIANPLLVDPNMRPVVGCTNMKKRARAGLGLRVEVALVPDYAFVAEKLGNLRVPVTWNSKSRSGGEVILFVVLAAEDIGVGVHRVTMVVDGACAGVESSTGSLVYEVMPVSIEAGDGAMVEANDQGLERLLAKCREHQCQAAKCSGDVSRDQG